ncbi:amidohydrolase family protein [Phyllobacterium sp. SB3]|uniref:amidohydrolase family protein n=1 Tax=Phyllobacterium sp. SB3 TaxID=3156073 RepID=UPI0032AF3BED
MPMVDAHIHFWDPTKNYYPWLNDLPLIPFRYGDYSRICRPYLPNDYKRDAGEHNVVKTVYIEAEWNPSDPLGEMTYIALLREKTGWPNVAVGQAWLDRSDRELVLERLSQFDFVRGLRHKPRYNPGPGLATPGSMVDPHWVEGFALLSQYGLRFDLQTPWWHLHEACVLADKFPETSIILLHSGLPADRSPEGILGWKSAMTEFSKRSNVTVKISGIGLPGQPWTVVNNRDIVLTIIDLFGPDRCMFGSNFPVDSLCGNLDEIFNGYKIITESLGDEIQKKLFHDNAVRIYDIR